MTFVNYAGVALQIVGVAVSGVGLWTTWREFALPNDRFFAPVIDPALEALRALITNADRLIRRLVRRPRGTVIRPITLSDTAHASARFSLRVQFGDLPKETAEALAAL